MTRATRLAAGAAAFLALMGQGRADPLPIHSDTTVHGDCRTLSVYGRPPASPCDGVVELIELNGGRNGIGFRSANGQLYWFLGPRAGEISPTEDTIYLPVDGVRVAGDRAGQDQKAVGICRYGNPYLGAIDIVCHAETMDGPAEAHLVSDGAEPQQR